MLFVELETRNFRFITVSETKKEAMEALKKAWVEHCEITGAWMTWEEAQESCRVFEIELNQVIKE